MGALQGGVVGGLTAEAQGKSFLKDGFWSGAGVGAAFGLVTSEQFKNTLKGQSWRSNQQVLNKFVRAGDYQGALDYFGTEATYDPDIVKTVREKTRHTTAGAVTNKYTQETFYPADAFDNYDGLKLMDLHESIHRKDFASRDMSLFDFSDPAVEKFFEVPAYWHQYKNIGLFPNSGLNPAANLKLYSGITVGAPSSGFSNKWYHFIYKIPRRFGVF